jgi:hypothetical protein
MTRKFIPVEEAFDRWQKDPEFVAAYDALHESYCDHARAGRRLQTKKSRTYWPSRNQTGRF